MSVASHRVGSETRLRVADGILSQEVSGEAVLVDPERGLYFGLDEVGASFWRLLEEHQKLGEIHSLLARRYAVDARRLGTDLETLVRELAAHGLVELDPPIEPR